MGEWEGKVCDYGEEGIGRDGGVEEGYGLDKVGESEFSLARRSGRGLLLYSYIGISFTGPEEEQHLRERIIEPTSWASSAEKNFRGYLSV